MKKVIGNTLKLAIALCFLTVPSFAQMTLDKPSYSPKEVAFMASVRASFAQNLIWERIFIVDRVANSPDVDKVKARLLASQDEIASIIRANYGDDTGNQAGVLLKQNVQALDDYANMVRSGAGDKTPLVTALYDNASAIASLLCLQNMYWNKDEFTASLKKYDDLIIAETNLQYPTAGSADATSFDTTFNQAMSLADTISIGTLKQFPSKFW